MNKSPSNTAGRPIEPQPGRDPGSSAGALAPPCPDWGRELIQTLDHHALAMAANNQARIRELWRYATEGFIQVFNRVPLLLNTNQSGRPGYVADPQTPYGVKYINRQLWLPPEERQRDEEFSQDMKPVVESLFLIGSSGSVGHNASSDLDYWVCHEDGAIEGRALELFQQKLAAITRWARDKHDTEANFYIINLADLRKGRLTKLNKTETEGEVAPLLLLEEFYRTFLFVAGRHPLWPILPLDADLEMYRDLRDRLAGDLQSEYVDLGFPSLPPPQEVLAAALWLARKSEADPFKGLLKIMVLLDYVESDLSRDPLCHEVKEHIISSPEDELPVDPYIVTINRVTDYGQRYLSLEELDLLRMASVLKVLGGGSEIQPAFFIPDNSPKRFLLSQWAKKWNWSRDRIVHLVNYNSWPEREQLHFGGELLNMLTGVYIRIAQYLIKKFPGQINPQDDDLAPLAARLLTRMGGLDYTVETLPSKIHYRSISNRLFLDFEPPARLMPPPEAGLPDGAEVPPIPEHGLWRLHALGQSNLPSEHNLIYGCPRAAKAAAWLVHNQIYGPGKSLIINNSCAKAPSPELFVEFMELLNEAFPHFEPRHYDLDNLWSPGGQGKIALALNFELRIDDQPELATADIISRTGWGEMRHHLVDAGGPAPLADRYLKVIQSLFKECGPRIRPENLIFLQPQTPELRKAMMNIRGGLSAAAKRKRSGGPGKSRIDISH